MTLICFVFVEENAGIALLLGASMCIMNLGYPSLSLITAPARTNPTTKERKADLILIRAYLCVYVCCFSSTCVSCTCIARDEMEPSYEMISKLDMLMPAFVVFFISVSLFFAILLSNANK